jgi:hypothetical protein
MFAKNTRNSDNAPRRQPPSRRGAILIQAVLFGSLVGVGLAALAVDVGLMFNARGETQRTADASALAGASGLMILQAPQRAQEYAYANPVAHQSLLPVHVDILTGNWNGLTRQFTATPPDGANGVLPNAARVVGTRQNLELFFGRALGIDEAAVRRAATAVAGAGRCAGIWGLEGVRTNGSIITDSYDPAVGPYGPGNIRPNGDVCSCKDIVVSGNISIRGDAMYGTGHDFVPHGGSYEVLGLVDDHPCDTPNIPIDYASAALYNDNDQIPDGHGPHSVFHGESTKLFLKNDQVLTLPPGTYYFESATITGQAALYVTGPTTIYIDGNARLEGNGIINVTQIAENLKLYIRGPNVTLSGTSAFFGALIAPTATINNLGDLTAFGVVLADELRVAGDVLFHVDEGLVFTLFGIRPIVPVLVQ